MRRMALHFIKRSSDDQTASSPSSAYRLIMDMFSFLGFLKVKNCFFNNIILDLKTKKRSPLLFLALTLLLRCVCVGIDVRRTHSGEILARHLGKKDGI